MLIDVALVPAEIPESHQIGEQAVLVIDVLRATSTIVTALMAGASSVVPVAEAAEANRLAEALGDGVVLAGERGGLPLPGFDLGNSPAEYTPEKVAGNVVVLTTTNGTYALRKVQSAGKVGTAAFVNAAAAASWGAAALHEGRNLLLVCAGTVRRFTWEDGCLAGYLVNAVQEQVAGAEISDGARAAQQIWAHAGSPTAALQMSRHGAELVKLGFAHDLEYCAQLSIHAAVPELHNARLVLADSRQA